MSIAAPLRERGEAVHLLGNGELRAQAGDLAGCEPAFTLRCEETPFIPGVDPTSASGIDRIQQRRTEMLWQDLDRLVDKHRLGPADVLLINSLRHWSLEAVVEWIERVGAARAPSVGLILHYTPHPQPGIPDPAAEIYKSAFERIAGSNLNLRIRLFTDSERLREEYQALHDLPITIVPIPHCDLPPAGRRVERGELTIAFAGEARRDKGFNLLPDAIRDVLAKRPGHKLSFNIHAYGADPKDFAEQWSGLSGNKAVRLVREPLDELEYESFIADADLMLIPYRRGPYQAQTSGIYCEAAALGIPVVAPANTWMADQISRNGGGVLFESENARSLAHACLEAIERYDDLQGEALRAAPAWRAFHNPEKFIAIVEAALESVPKSVEAQAE